MYHYLAEERQVLRTIRRLSKSPAAIRPITAHHFSRYKQMVDLHGLNWEVSDFLLEYPELNRKRQPNTGSATEIGFWARAALTVARKWGWERKKANGSRLLPKRYWRADWRPAGVRRGVHSRVQRPRRVRTSKPRSPNGNVETILQGLFKEFLDRALEAVRR